jgi:hypothetical protein
MAKLVHSAAQIEAVKASGVADWLDQMKARQRLYDPQPLVSGNSASAMRPDLRLTEAGQRDAPLTRLVAASELHSRKLDGLAEAAPVAASQTDMNSTVLAQRRARSFAHVPGGARDRLLGCHRGHRAGAGALSQIYLSMRFKAASDQWQDRVEGVISEQRNGSRRCASESVAPRAERADNGASRSTAKRRRHRLRHLRPSPHLHKARNRRPRRSRQKAGLARTPRE